MKKYLYLSLMLFTSIILINPQQVLADEETVVEEKASTFKLNVRRIGLELSSNSVSNATAYKNTGSPITDLTADGETVVKGVLDAVAEYNAQKYQWNNGIYMEYAKTTLKPADGGPEVDSETADKILLFTDYAYKMSKYKDMDFGPMAQIEYQTEFTTDDGADRYNVVRGKTGFTLFNGKVIKNLYLVGLGEYEFTYDEPISKFGIEAGGRIEYTLREGVSASMEGYYRYYLSYSEYVPSDLEYDLYLKANLDVDVYQGIKVGPYISYRKAQQRESGSPAGSALGIGLSLSYAKSFDIW